MITLLQFIVFTGYLLIIYNRYSVLESISHSSYEVKYYFTLMCWLLAFLNFFQGMEGWGFLTSVGLMFTGITVDWKYYKVLHFTGAVCAIGGGFLGLIILHDIWITSAIFVIIALLTHGKRNWLWWVEIQAFALILISYLLR